MSSSEEESDHQVDCDENSLCKYGSQLPQFDADEIPSKKPVHVEDMIVKDENGKRRFHGAFTGGFSAGYWNTVGSKEGFIPSEFKSSRNEKMTFKQLQPSDFMDEEDFSEFGIAPQKIQTKVDFEANSSKRKRDQISDGPIPGEPVLLNLLKPIRDKAAVRILKTMGWRENQGIGSRVTYREKKQLNEQNKREMYINQKYADKEESEDEEMSDDEEITFAPDDFDPFIAEIKQNTFGLGYSGLRASASALSSTSSQSHHVELFQPFQVIDRKNKKLSIRGQAFGVGALEDEDDDIYAIDDMSNYDKMLESEKEKSRKPIMDKPFDASVIEGFSRATINDGKIEVFRIDVPRDFVPRNFLERKSRFAPIDVTKAKEIELQKKHKLLGLGRHDLKPNERGDLINETKTKEESKRESTTNEQKQESARKIVELLNSKQFISEHSKKNENFKPFAGYPEKQERYEKFIALKSNDEKEIDKLLNDIQPLSMSSFDREMEKKEFIQAKRMYQPLDSLMANRFIKESDVHKEQQQQVQKKNDNEKETVVIQRSKLMWKPHKILCKLFNIPEPYGGMMFDEEEEQKSKKKQSNSSLFDYIGVPLNTKSNFVTPQVIPRKITDDNRKKQEEEERRKNFLDAIEKEKSFMNNRATEKDFFDIKPSTSRKILKEPEPPKTELEIKVIESIEKKPEEKQDLFKAIFCDSDEDEEVSIRDKESKIIVDEDKISLSEQQKSTFIKSFLSTKSAGEINVLRNASPPRGIFKNIFDMTTTQKSSSKEKVAENNEIDANEDNIRYGPVLPKSISTSISKEHNSDDSSSSSNSSLDEKLLKKLKKIKSREKWVEKDKVNKSKKKKKKKSHKKSSHKKHKSKK